MSSFSKWVAAMAASAGFAGVAQAQTDVPAGLHNTSENWTLAGSPYRLKGQVYFTAGTTLTIDAGVVIASLPADQGSLAITRGAQIFVNGTASNPVIFTSTADTDTWIGGDPKTGIWREACLEWGNLTIMGDAYISENAVAGNTPAPSATNVANMEGLNSGPSTDRYGGGDDDDDSGSITYASFRYGGKVVGLTNELNGLSLGGIGRNTDINHVEIMNNVDDGIEIWGGTVNIKNFSIWNVGDDSFDVDQGWRGKAQFGLIVQGHSANDVQGSGVGDNAFETDGAEQSDYQPVTTATIYNCTVIGQPVDGDHGTAWRDNARVQYRNCIFMDLGERLVSFDNVDGDGGAGYGIAGTLSWANTWTTAYTATSTVNPFPGEPAGGNPTGHYRAQTSGMLAEITDSVFFRNTFATAYTEATARGVVPGNGTNNNVQIVSTADVDSPIVSLTRGQQIIRGGKIIKPVTGLDPRPANQALTSVNAAPADGFFTSANYRGAFEPVVTPWIDGWTAADAYGFLNKPVTATSNYCTAGTTSNSCVPSIYGIGRPSASAGSDFSIVVLGVEVNKQGLIFYGVAGQSNAPWGTGSSFLCVKAPTQRTPVQSSGFFGTTTTPTVNCTGEFNLDWNQYHATHPGVVGQPLTAGTVFDAQAWFRDPPASKTTNLSGGLEFVLDP